MSVDRGFKSPVPGDERVLAWVAFGSNLGDREAQIDRALALIAECDEVELGCRSTIRETAPVGGPPQGPFLNGVVELRTSLGPRALLDLLLRVEASLGRVRAERFGPRTIDLDLLLYGTRIIDEPGLEVPHPRLIERAFVLEPLAEIAPDLRHPATGRTIAEHWRELRDGGERFVTAKRIKVIEDARVVRASSDGFRKAGLSVGFVPTLGGLHRGHRALMDRAREECDRVIVSIYLNPTQFDAQDDLATYPASTSDDIAFCEAAGVDVVWLGRRSDLLPEGFATQVEVPRLTRRLCGAFRPGHFRGVATVVTQLLLVTKPHRAYFGLKDFQQALVIERMVRDLWIDTEILKAPTVREADGLAASSRNARLTLEERAVAPVLYQSLSRARERIFEGELRVAELERSLRESIAREPRFRIEYAEVLRASDLEPFAEGIVRLDNGVLIAAAAHLGAARLIDNVWIPPSSKGCVDPVDRGEHR